MTPMFSNALYFSLDGRFFKLRADRCFFFLARYLFQLYACCARSRKLVGLVPFYLWSISRVEVSSSRTCTMTPNL